MLMCGKTWLHHQYIYGYLKFFVLCNQSSRSWISWPEYDLQGPCCIFNTEWEVQMLSSKKNCFLREIFEAKGKYFGSNLWANSCRGMIIELKHWDFCNKTVRPVTYFIEFTFCVHFAFQSRNIFWNWMSALNCHAGA